MALRTAKRDTPTSAKTASHMPAKPKAPRHKKTIFTPRANIIFCRIIFFVYRAISTASTSFDGSSVIRTTSAASTAASLPSPHIAIPMSAIARTGASFIPSPIKASFPFGFFCAFIISSFSAFSWGSNPP